MEDLVAKAKAVDLGAAQQKPATKEEIGLLIAFFSGEVSTGQVEMAVFGRKGSGGRLNNWVSRTARAAWAQGIIGEINDQS